jgi:hypothetical protein
MANRNSGHRAGGGIASNKRVEKPVRTGTPSRGVSPAGVSQIGSSMGNHVTEVGRKMNPRGAVTSSYGGKAPVNAGAELGNANALRGVGVGGGRTIHGTGSQSRHGPVAGQPKPQGRDILSEFGPDSANVRGRR